MTTGTFYQISENSSFLNDALVNHNCHIPLNRNGQPHINHLRVFFSFRLTVATRTDLKMSRTSEGETLARNKFKETVQTRKPGICCTLIQSLKQKFFEESTYAFTTNQIRLFIKIYIIAYFNILHDGGVAFQLLALVYYINQY